MKKLFIIIFLSVSLFFRAESQKISRFKILYTNDEHGWFEPVEDFSGAAGMLSLWNENENYQYRDSFLVLSGGDMWTGPAVSTWYKGLPMTQIMKKMDYDAASAGNHEFDFSQKILSKNIRKEGFPILAANITEKKTNKIPSYLQPYIILNVVDLKVGIIGLANLETPETTFPANVKDLNFADYKSTIEKWAPIVKEQGADIIIILGHLILEEQEELIETAKKFNIPIISGGHSHQRIIETVDGITYFQTGSKLRNYIKLDVEYNHETSKTTVKNIELIENKTNKRDAEVSKINDFWKHKAEAILSEKIGYCNQKIDADSYEMENLICDSWLYSFPDADISITNGGGIRQSILEGNITLETAIGVLPFNNTIFQLKLTGKQILDCTQNFCVGGFSLITKKMSDGTDFDENKIYTVLTTDYLYSVNATNFKKYDTKPYETGVLYRQPLIDWLKSIKSDSNNPLNKYLDSVPRITEQAKTGEFH